MHPSEISERCAAVLTSVWPDECEIVGPAVLHDIASQKVDFVRDPAGHNIELIAIIELLAAGAVLAQEALKLYDQIKTSFPEEELMRELANRLPAENADSPLDKDQREAVIRRVTRS